MVAPGVSPSAVTPTSEMTTIADVTATAGEIAIRDGDA
jgi:hypothetical protein